MSYLNFRLCLCFSQIGRIKNLKTMQVISIKCLQEATIFAIVPAKASIRLSMKILSNISLLNSNRQQKNYRADIDGLRAIATYQCLVFIFVLPSSPVALLA